MSEIIEAILDRIFKRHHEKLLEQLLLQLEKNMSALTALQDSVNRNKASIDALRAAVDALPKGGVPEADVAAAAAGINANSDALDAITASISPPPA